MKGVTQPVPVIAVAVDRPFTEDTLDDSHARMDDMFWAAYINRPFTWQRFLTWWVARRYVIPRDIRKE